MERDKWIFSVRRPISDKKGIVPADSGVLWQSPRISYGLIMLNFSGGINE
jgi:hypothetical protein